MMEYKFKGTITAMGHPLVWRVLERDNEDSRIPFGIEAVTVENTGSWVIPICDIERLNNQTPKDILRNDAHLIAAAPDLLQACIEIVKQKNDITRIDNDKMYEAIHNAEQAIKKALNIAP